MAMPRRSRATRWNWSLIPKKTVCSAPSRVVLDSQLMMPLRAHVEDGRVVLDEPAELPEGARVEVCLVESPLTDATDDLDDEERAELHRALDQGMAEADAGDVVPAADVIAELRALSGK